MIQAADLDQTVRGFSALVALILTLITLFTGTRDAAVRTLEDRVLTGESKRHLAVEMKLALGLFAITVLLLIAGMPLWVRVWRHWSWSSDHSIRWVFVIVWALLVSLALWQLNIARRAAEKSGRRWPKGLRFP
jgi:hypothetical protein